MSNSANESITTDELSHLHDPKSLKALLQVGGLGSLISKLKTDSREGIDGSDQEDRQTKYGENKLPAKPIKSFFQLCWEALQDKVLIILSVAAVVSLALGLYETFGQSTQYDDEGKPLPKVEWVEGVAIIVAILIVVLVGAANDYQKERQFVKLNSKKEEREIIVIRKNKKEVISIYNLVVGDLINLETGDVIPADAVLLSGQVECDESALTGESKTIKKVPAETALSNYRANVPEADIDIGDKGVDDPFLISGSKVLSGLGVAVVTAVGPNSIHGRTMASLNVETESTPLQERLDNLATGIAKYGFIAAILLFVVLFIRFCVNLRPHGEYHLLDSTEKGKKFLDIIIVSITIVVVAIPEGLPLAVTLALAFATTRMAKDDNLVRVLRSCETMGGATTICSDKTGTLTENKMRVVRGIIGDSEFNDTVDTTEKSSAEILENVDSNLKNLITINIILNSTAFENSDYNLVDDTVANNRNSQPLYKRVFKKLFKDDLDEPNVNIDSSEPFIGSKTETALLLLASAKFSSFTEHSLESIRQLNNKDIVQTIPFESSRKWGGLVIKISENRYRLFVKGASEIVFKKCKHELNFNGKVSTITPDRHHQILSKIDDYASDALRTLALGHKDFILSEWPPEQLISCDNSKEADPNLLIGEDMNFNIPTIVIEDESDKSKIEDGLTLDCIVGIQDPLRAGVAEAVAQCKRAGVSVRMVTGDNIATAKAISRNCGILQPEDLENPNSCIEGPRFRELSVSERRKIAPGLRVLARSSPEDKRILVETLRNLGEVVAVTGDGTNDAPALKLADVGFSMGIAGTEVAREASDIILMTDDFSAIVGAIKWGRTVATSIKKFIQFQLTVNITACVLTFVSAVASSDGESVLTAVQLLWVNLIMDTLAALALATDKPDDSFLNRKPAGRTAPLIAVSTWKMILGQSTTQLIVTFVLNFAGKRIFFGSQPITSHQSTQLSAMTFNAFVWLQFFKLFVTRKLDEADGITNIRDRITWNNLNFFEHLFRNWYFIAIASIIGGFQVLIMFVGGAAFSIARQTPGMWATAILCGLVSLPVGIILRIIPDEWVLKIFPTKLVKKIIYIVGFEFLSRDKTPIEDIENSSAYESDNNNELPFTKAKQELSHLKSKSSNSSLHSPLQIYKDWKISRSSSNSSVMSSNSPTLISSDGSQHHQQNYANNTVQGHLAPPTMTALMVPTVVGGAVAGWHQNPTTDSTNEKLPNNA